ncbi:MAG TPA: MMPL family transporter [Pirellulaceae bacterium]|nr:MMPL family transporter [Pirellulaceae bacterium]
MTDRPAAFVVLLAALVLLPLTVIGVRAAIRSNANDVRDWLPSHYEETRQYGWFHQQFGSEDFVIISWPGCTLDDVRLDRLAERLRTRSEQNEKRGAGSLFRRVTTGRELVEQLTSEPVDLNRSLVITRLKGTIIGADGQQTCAVVTLSDWARTQLHTALAEIRGAASEIGLAPAEVHLGGPAVVNAAIDVSSTQSLVRLAALAALIGLAIAWLCFRTVRLTGIVFVIAGYSAALSLAVVPLCGVPLNAILVTMVPLVYVAAMSGAIHLSNYYLASCREGHTSDAIRRAVRHAALPLGLATTTTAAGLLSLWYSDLAPIRLFGLFSAIGIGIGLALQLVLLPALLTLWPVGKQGIAAADVPAVGDDEIEPLSPRWQRLASLVISGHAWIAAACLAALTVGGLGLTRMETSIQIMRLFSPRTPIIASYAWLEQNLGALVPMEVVIRFEAANQQPMADRLRLVRKLHESIAETPQVGGCLSAATFTPQISPTGASLRGFMVNRRLRQARPLLADAGYLIESDRGELWRISVRVSAGEDLDYGLFQEDVRRRVEPLLAQAQRDGHPGISAVYTGAIPIIYKARRSLLDGLILGFGTDVALVVVAVVVLLRHWSSGVLLFLTSVFPMALVFGTMGWLGIVVDIGSVMTPCVALGVTIDDVIHFVLWFRRGIARGLSVAAAVDLAYAGCGRAMVQSWGVIGLGLAAFALSSFIPTFRFGALMIGLLTVGLAGNLLFLPALLAGPLGQIVAASVRRRTSAAESSHIRQESEAASL